VYAAPIENGQTLQLRIFVSAKNWQPPEGLIKRTVHDKTCHCVRSLVGGHFERLLLGIVIC